VGYEWNQIRKRVLYDFTYLTSTFLYQIITTNKKAPDKTEIYKKLNRYQKAKFLAGSPKKPPENESRHHRHDASSQRSVKEHY
jgi:hypothetical protein